MTEKLEQRNPELARRGGLIKGGDIAERIAFEQDCNQALERKAMGFTYRQIGELQGVSEATAFKRVRRALENARPHEAVEQLRMSQGAEAQVARRQLWPLVLDEDEPVERRLAALDRLQRLWDHEARLFGVYQVNAVEAAEMRSEALNESGAEITHLIKSVLTDLGIPIDENVRKTVRTQLLALIETHEEISPG